MTSLILSLLGIGGTKTTTKTTNQYNTASMNAFNSMTPQMSGVMSDYMKDPQKASYFLLQAGMLDRQARMLGARGVSNVMNNSFMSRGGGGMPGFLQASLGRAGRQTGAMQSQGYLQALMQAEQNRRWAAGQAAGYKPLQTGQETTQQTSGLGTWLPQVIGMGASAALGFATGGASLGAKFAGMGKGLVGQFGGGSQGNAFSGTGSNSNNFYGPQPVIPGNYGT